MDRLITYPGAIPLESDILNPQRFQMIALGNALQAVLGTGNAIDGMACVPTAPATLSVQVLPGSIYSLQNVESNAYGSLSADVTHTTVKQGILYDTSTLTLTPPGTSGQAINYLIQVAFSEVDDTPLVLPYYNASNPSVAYAGASNSGTAQNTVRRQKAVVSAKAGTAATAGTQVTPAPDAGYVGLYAVTVAYGATQLTSGQINQLSTAPFIAPKLPQVMPTVQQGAFAWAQDTGAANALVVTLTPAPTSLSPGFEVRVKIAANNTGATTINVNGLGAKSLLRPTGTALQSGDIKAGSVVSLTYDGTSFFLQTIGVVDFTVTDPRYVLKAGDVMTGNLSMPNLQVNNAASNFRDLTATTNNVNRWNIRMADATAETGSNAGSDWSMGRYADAGTFIEWVLKCVRSTGVFDFARAPTVAGSPLSTVIGASISNMPVGAVMLWPGSAPPSGFIELNGSLLSRSTYSALWTAVQSSGMLVTDALWTATTVGPSGNWGKFSQGDGSTTFRIPDFRGEFLRMWDNGRGIDSGRTLGGYQESTLLGSSPSAYAWGFDSGNEVRGFSNSDGTASTGVSPFTVSSFLASGTEVVTAQRIRPRNIAVMPCIKY